MGGKDNLKGWEKVRDLLQPVCAAVVNNPAEMDAVLANRDVAQPRSPCDALIKEAQITEQLTEGR